MCRSIKLLRHPPPRATQEEIEAAARQFVRKVSGFRKPSRANEAAFEGAIAQIASVTDGLLNQLAPPSAPAGE